MKETGLSVQSSIVSTGETEDQGKLMISALIAASADSDWKKSQKSESTRKKEEGARSNWATPRKTKTVLSANLVVGNVLHSFGTMKVEKVRKNRSLFGI